MSSTVIRRAVISALLVALATAPAMAQDGSYPGGQTAGDYRWALYTACSLVFLAIVVYLVMTHKTGAKLSDDIAHLERRIDELER